MDRAKSYFWKEARFMPYFITPGNNMHVILDKQYYKRVFMSGDRSKKERKKPVPQNRLH